MKPTSPLRHDWPALARFAASIRDDRAAADPALVEKGRLPPPAAADRARLGAALAQFWACVAGQQDLPDTELDCLDRFSALPVELLADAARVADAFAQRAAARPADKALARRADAAACLLWHHQPHRAEWGAWPSRIAMVHAANQAIRASRGDPARARAA